MSSGQLPKTTLNLAYSFVCDNCGINNFAHAEIVEMTPEQKEARYRQQHDLEDYAELPEDWWKFDIMGTPHEVVCKDCGTRFETVAENPPFEDLI